MKILTVTFFCIIAVYQGVYTQLSDDQISSDGNPSYISTDGSGSAPLAPFIPSSEGNPPVIPPGTPWNDVCTLPKEIGSCKAAIERYYYSKENNLCEAFYYGGCGGNYNNFATLNECKLFCGRGGLLAVPEHPPAPPQFKPRDFPKNDDQSNTDNTQDNMQDNTYENNISDSNSNTDNTNNTNENSSGNRNKLQTNWPIFGGLLAGFYSLARNLLFW